LTALHYQILKKQKHESIIEHLRNRFDNDTEEKARDEFNKTEQNTKENVHDYAARLERIFNRAYEIKSNQSKETQELRMQILKRQFIHGMEASLQEKTNIALAMQANGIKVISFQDLVKLAARLQASNAEKKEKKLSELIRSI